MQKTLAYKLFWVAIIGVGLIAGAGLLSEKGMRLIRSTGAPGDQTVQVPAGQASSPLAQPRSDGSHPRQAAKAERRAQKGSRIPVGQTPIPIIVNGKEKAPLVGSTLQEKLPEVRIATLHDARTGWAVADILSAQGVTQAKQVVFVDDKGKRWSTSWAQITDPKTRLILAYSKHDTLLLFSGPQIDAGKRQSARQIRETVADRTDLVSFPNVVKIEVIG
ncbi:MAG: hypothetical protein HY208_00500 [Nitrospirae bacterium]|nr:hypothetical protein [Nitrospirota bacterium]